MNYIENLPFDLQELISIKLHKLYMYDLQEEIYEEFLEYQWRLENNLGDDFDEDYEMDIESDSDSNYSFVSDSSF